MLKVLSKEFQDFRCFRIVGLSVETRPKRLSSRDPMATEGLQATRRASPPLAPSLRNLRTDLVSTTAKLRAQNGQSLPPSICKETFQFLCAQLV